MTYRKIVYQIKLFLRHLEVTWESQIRLPDEPEYTPKRVTRQDIETVLQRFQGHKYEKQLRALILLGSSSGARSHELYLLTKNDIDINSRTLYIRHDGNGHTTKTGKSRTTFFTEEAKAALIEYYAWLESHQHVRYLFGGSHLVRVFRNSPVKIKDMRKAFSQEWTRRNGNTSVKKLLMGHSIRGDVDLQCYNFQSEADLRLLYDKIMGDSEVS